MRKRAAKNSKGQVKAKTNTFTSGRTRRFFPKTDQGTARACGRVPGHYKGEFAVYLRANWQTSRGPSPGPVTKFQASVGPRVTNLPGHRRLSQ